MSAGATVTQADRDLAEEWRSEFVSWDNQDADEQVRDLADDFARHRLATEAEFAAREAALVEALEIAWAEAHRMRNAAKLVGPYPNDRVATKVWARSLYHAGKDLCEKLKPYRALARAHTTSEGEG